MIVINDGEIKLNKTDVIDILAEIYDLPIPWASKVAVVGVINKHLDPEEKRNETD